MDPCFLFRHYQNNELYGIVISQVDDSLALGSNAFMEDEERESRKFKTNPRTFLGTQATTFKGIRITLERVTFHVEKTDKIEKLKVAETPTQFASQRAATQYVFVNSRPEVCANVQLIAPGKDPLANPEYKSFKKFVSHLQETKDEGLHFVRLYMKTVRLMVISDASFAIAEGM